jgi:hypothetical protein
MEKPQLLYVLIFILLALPGTSSAQTTFTDVTQIAGVGDAVPGTGVAFGDYDNDGDLDIYVANGGTGDFPDGAPNFLYRNNGDGTFTDVASEAGVAHPGTGEDVAFGDYDNDGDLDIRLGNYDEADVLYRNNGDGTFSDVTAFSGIGKVMVALGTALGDYDNDGDLDIFSTNYRGNNVLYRNEGDGTFTDVAGTTGVEKSSSGMGTLFLDYDNDGDLDIYAVNQGGADILHCNNGDGTFTDVTEDAGVSGSKISVPGQGTASGDYDNDGDLDIYVVGYPNILYRNNGDGTFTDVALEAGVSYGEVSLVVTFGDYDNDGYLDIYLGNGYDSAFPEADFLYRNNGDGTFTDVTGEADVGNIGEALGVAFGDYDNDGFLDIYVVNYEQPNMFYHNNGNDNNWLHVKTVGTISNRDGIGAKVRVVAGDLSMIREISGSTGFHCFNSMMAEFGLGRNAKADLLEIRWPSGIVDTFTDVRANQVIEVTEGASEFAEMEGLFAVIHGVFPVFGDPAGGTPVQILGTHFLPGSRVFFGGNEAPDVRVESPSLITAVTPPGAKGTVDVEVVRPDGKRGIVRDGFRYATLLITRITPEIGPVTGGITVQIEGYGFQSGAQVHIGESLLADAFVTPMSIRGTLPPGEPGTVDVSVTNPDGERDVLSHAFTYVPPPVIERVSPAFVPLTGFGQLNIIGSGFIGTPTVYIGGVACRKVQFVSSERLEVTTPQVPTVGRHDVAVINPGGQRAVLPDGVTVLAPIKIRSVEPANGGLEGGTRITIVGEPTVEFQGRTFPSRFVRTTPSSVVKVLIGDVEATSETFQSDNVITAITPPNTPGPKSVKVVNPDGQFDTLKDAFTYNVLPQITKVIPDNGKLAGGTVVTIRGSGFLPGAKVLISTETGTLKTASSVQVVSPEIITALTPPGNPGPRDVIIRNPDKQEMTLPGGFTYNPMPTITRITPDYGTAAGGTKLTIEGTGFLQGARVAIGERAGTTMVRDDMTIEAVTPPNPPGLWDVRVVNPDTQEVIVREAFVSVGELVYNYPNPFRASEGTTFRYVTNQHVEVITVKIFNLRGVPIGVVQQVGSKEVKWHDPSVHVGLYVYLLEARLEDGKVRRFKNALEVCK